MTSPLQAMMTLLIMCLMTLSAVQACETEDGQPILQCITPANRTCDLTLDQNGEHYCLPCLYPPKNGARLPSCQKRAASASASNSGNLNTFGCATDNLIATCLTTKQKNHVNNLLEETDARSDANKDSESVSISVILIIVGAVLAVLGMVIVFFTKRKRQLEEDEEDSSSPDAISLDIPETPSATTKSKGMLPSFLKPKVTAPEEGSAKTSGAATKETALEEAPTTAAKSKGMLFSFLKPKVTAPKEGSATASGAATKETALEEAPTTAAKSKEMLSSFLKPKVTAAKAVTKATALAEGFTSKAATKNKRSQMFRSNKETAVPKGAKAKPTIPAAAKPEMNDPESDQKLKMDASISGDSGSYDPEFPVYNRSRTSSVESAQRPSEQFSEYSPRRESSIDGRITNTDDFTSVMMSDEFDL